jgi:CO/xanthine dehydrogenase Mo-binding subunit
MAESKLVGQNYTTPDLRAKITGRARYAEDFKAEGMLHARLLLSPYSHARVLNIDASAALAMPGVKAILTADEVPGPKDQVNDAGVMIRANPRSEKALTNEPLYQGEPVLAVAAVDELTAAEAIEKIRVRWQPLPFSVDPVASLLPGASNPRVEGTVWIRPAPPKPGQSPGIPEVQDIKWTDDEAEEYRAGRLPMGKDTDPSWSYGDLEAGFKKASLVLDETFVTPNTSHQCLESRSSMAYWQNGKLFIHLSTQSTVQTVMSVSRWLELQPENIVLIGAYCGGGYGAKGTGTVTDIIPALLSKKTGTPVQMRISREEEHSIGGARPALHGRMKLGLTKEGRITALDMFTVVEGGPYGPGGDGNSAGRFASLMFQPEAMRWRGVTAITNTPPRRAQSQPGGMQGIVLMEAVIDRAARKLGIDQVEIRKINAPAGRAQFGPANAQGNRTTTTSCFLKETLDKGRELFKWDERTESPERTAPGIEGAGRRRGDQLVQRRIGRLRRTLRHQAGRPDVHPDRSRQPRYRIVLGLSARRCRNDGRAVGKSRAHLGRHVEASPLELRVGRQPDHSRPHARGARVGERRDQEAAADCGKGSRRPARGLRRRQRARREERRRRWHDARTRGATCDRAWRCLRWPRTAEGDQRVYAAVCHGARGSGPDGRRARHVPAQREHDVVLRGVCRGRS